MFPSISVTTGPCPTANAAVLASARADTREPRPSARSVNTEPPTPSAAPAPSTDSRPQSASLSSPMLDSSASLTDTTRSAIGKGKTSTCVQAADRPFELRKEMKPTAHNFAINEWLSVPGNEGRAQSEFQIYWNGLSCQDKKSLLPLSAVVFLFVAAPQPLVVVQSAATTLGPGASQGTIVTHSESPFVASAAPLSSTVSSSAAAVSAVSSPATTSLSPATTSSPAAFPPRAASPPVVIAQPAVDTPPSSSSHTTLQPILSIQSAPTAAARTVTNDSRHKALGVASGRKQWQYQRQYRLIRLWEKAKLASALAKRHHARIGDVFITEEKTQTRPHPGGKSSSSSHRAEDANRSMAIINTGQPIPESNLYHGREATAKLRARFVSHLFTYSDAPPSLHCDMLHLSNSHLSRRRRQTHEPRKSAALSVPQHSHRRKNGRREFCQRREFRRRCACSAAACKPNADNLQVSNVPDPPPANSSTLQDLGTCKNKVTCKQKLSVSLAKATPSTPSKAMPPSVIHTATAFVHAVAPTSAPATPPTRGSPPRRPQRPEPSLPRRWLNQGRPAISSNHHKATVFQVACQRRSGPRQMAMNLYRYDLFFSSLVAPISAPSAPSTSPPPLQLPPELHAAHTTKGREQPRHRLADGLRQPALRAGYPNAGAPSTAGRHMRSSQGRSSCDTTLAADLWGECIAHAKWCHEVHEVDED
ncbi:hypothetical protein BC826DRAFT_1112587 [Russula brevipes]|nr:hypothetical protein BC826DRAFT_1112587 [Russula brevipes]